MLHTPLSALRDDLFLHTSARRPTGCRFAAPSFAHASGGRSLPCPSSRFTHVNILSHAMLLSAHRMASLLKSQRFQKRLAPRQPTLARGLPRTIRIRTFSTMPMLLGVSIPSHYYTRLFAPRRCQYCATLLLTAETQLHMF